MVWYSDDAQTAKTLPTGKTTFDHKYTRFLDDYGKVVHPIVGPDGQLLSTDSTGRHLNYQGEPIPLDDFGRPLNKQNEVMPTNEYRQYVADVVPTSQSGR